MIHPLGKDPPQVPLAQHDHEIETLATNGANEAFAERVGVSSRLHRPRAVRHKPSASPIPSIRCVAGRFS
jgi:hypothetical protein